MHNSIQALLYKSAATTDREGTSIQKNKHNKKETEAVQLQLIIEDTGTGLKS